MKKKKRVILAFTVLMLLLSLVAIGIGIKGSKDRREGKGTETGSEIGVPKGTTADGGGTTAVIPRISGKEPLQADTGILKIDISGMRRDLNPSVIGGKVEYGTKEIGDERGEGPN